MHGILIFLMSSIQGNLKCLNVNLTNGFHVAVRLFNNRSQLTPKCGMNKKTCICGLDVTFSASCDWSVAIFMSLESQESYLTLRNLTLQRCLLITRDFFRLHSTFARLYNAAASPASHLRSAGLLAIIVIIIILITDTLIIDLLDYILSLLSF